MFTRVAAVTCALTLTACIDLDVYDRVNKQTVLVKTPMANGASCSLTDRTGRKEYTGDTPSAATISVGRPPLTVICWKPGFRKATYHFEEEYIPIESFPTILEELTGFLKDPFKQPGARFPTEVEMWLEPLRWPSSAYEIRWRASRKAYLEEQERKKLEMARKKEALRELELLLKYRKENESIRDPRFDGGFLDYLELKMRRLAGGSMIPDLVRESSDLDSSLNNLTAEELAEEFLAYKHMLYLREINGGAPEKAPNKSAQ